MLSGSFPIIFPFNHTTFSQTQTDATVPLNATFGRGLQYKTQLILIQYMHITDIMTPEVYKIYAVAVVWMALC